MLSDEQKKQKEEGKEKVQGKDFKGALLIY